MNPEERQKLREKHVETTELYCAACAVVGFDGESLSRKQYPCDVIKVLDSYDKQDADILEIIHTYDQEPISAIVRIWNLLGNRA
jgi:hypothetical protein